jgi:hypothetical protein
MALPLLSHPLAAEGLGVLEEGGEGPPVLLALLSGLVGREGVLAFVAMARLCHRRQRSPLGLLDEALFSRYHHFPGCLDVTMVSGSASGCLSLRRNFRRCPPLGIHEMSACLVVASRLERREQCPLLRGGLLGLAVIRRVGEELGVLLLILLYPACGAGSCDGGGGALLLPRGSITYVVMRPRGILSRR